MPSTARTRPRPCRCSRPLPPEIQLHKAAARYNVANLLANAKNLSEARGEAAAILADPSLSSVHGITKELQGYIANLEDTAEGWTTLIDNTVEVLSKPAAAVMADAKSQGRIFRGTLTTLISSAYATRRVTGG